MRRTIVMRRKTYCPVLLEVTDMTTQSLLVWIDHAKLSNDAFLFQAGLETRSICQRDSTRAALGDGATRSDLMSCATALIRCVERKLHLSIEGPRILARFSYFWDIPNWKVQYDTSASRLMMRLRSLSKPWLKLAFAGLGLSSTVNQK